MHSPLGWLIMNEKYEYGVICNLLIFQWLQLTLQDSNQSLSVENNPCQIEIGAEIGAEIEKSSLHEVLLLF